MTEKERIATDAEKMREFMEERARRRYQVLEEDTRRLKRDAKLLKVGILLILTLSVTVSARPQLLGLGRSGGVELITVRHLVLEDADGTPRGEWWVDDEGNARLALHDQHGQTRLSLSVLGTGSPGLSLIDAEGKKRAALGLLPDETTNLVFADQRGIPRAVLGLNRSQATHLVFADANGSSQVALGLDGNGVGSFLVPGEAPPADSVDKNEN